MELQDKKIRLRSLDSQYSQFKILIFTLEKAKWKIQNQNRGFENRKIKFEDGKMGVRSLDT